MNYSSFIKNLVKIKDLDLSDEIINNKMNFSSRIKELIELNNKKINYRKSSVLILVYPSKDQIPKIVLLQRPQSLEFHPGQICFPGGKYQNADQTNLNTALRETNEEIGIPINKIKYIKKLTKIYIPPSKFEVYPFLAYMNETPNFIIDKKEVDVVTEFPISFLLYYNSKKKIRIKNDSDEIINCYKYGDKIIWGATAIILYEFEFLIKKIFNKNYI